MLFAALTSAAQTETNLVSDSTQLSTPTLQPSILIGYLSYDSALVSMPQYNDVEKKMGDMRKAYETELKRVEEEFNEKYEAFLEGRKDFPRTILLKRQTELEQLLQRNIEFKEQSLKQLAEARKEAMKPLQQLLNETIARIAHTHGLTLVVNTDANACPFIDAALSRDISQEVRMELAKVATVQ